jgi:hypothetical protein
VDGGDGEEPACGRLTTFEQGRLPDRELWVDPAGDDQTGDGSAALPFASLARAAREATPGTAIRLLPGQHAPGAYLADLRGAPEAPIWVGGAPGRDRPVFVGGGQALHLVRPRYVVLHDLEVRGASANGVNVDDGGDREDPDAARFVVFRGLDLHDVGGDGNQDCLKLSGLRDFWVLDSRFARCGGGGAGSGVDCVGCHRGLIARSTFEHGSGNAVQAKGGSQELEIRQCRLLEPGERGVNLGGSTDFDYFRPPLDVASPNAEARDLRLVSSLIVGGHAAAAFVGCQGCLVAHNTIVDPHRWVFRILQETVTSPPHEFVACREGRFVNNLVFFSRAGLSTFVNVGPNTAPETFELRANLWYAHDDPTRSEPTGLPVAEQDGLVGLEPAFLGGGEHPYAIPAASPAAGRGAPGTGVEADLAGRCYRDPPSIGAYEAR